MTRSTGGELPLQTLLLAMSIPDAALSALRDEFPEIRFVALGEDPDGTVSFSGSPDTPAEDDLAIADAVIGWHVSPETINAAPRLRWIHSGGAGVSHFDLAAIKDRGVMLTNSSGISAPNMAEHVLGMMIALARRLPHLMRAQSKRAWRDHETHREVVELQGQSLAIIGMGEIGRAVAVRAAPFGMRVTGLRRRPDGALPAGFDAVFDITALPDALVDADQVVLTLPDTPQTRGLFDAATFAAMKPGATIYNVGRGAVIDTAALIDALQSGHLGGAGLDVTDPEPLPEDSPLWDMENVLITAHTSGATPRYWDRQQALIADNIRRIQRGESPRNLVDLDAGY